MEFAIVGIKSLVGVKSRKTGKDMNAFVLHLVRENPRDTGLAGCEVKQQFVDAGFLTADIQRLGGYAGLCGMRAEIGYDDGGFVDSITLL